MPQYPIYVPLLPDDAKLAIGQLHSDAELPFSILLDEGFDADTYVDIFDGGPTVEARVDTLRTMQHQRRLPLASSASDDGIEVMSIISNTRAEHFRAVLARVRLTSTGVRLSQDVAATLGVTEQDHIRIVDLLPDNTKDIASW